MDREVEPSWFPLVSDCRFAFSNLQLFLKTLPSLFPQTGAFVAGKPVLPVVLRYPHCRGSDFNPSWESVSVQKHLFVLLSTWKHSLRVGFPRPSSLDDSESQN